MEYDQVKIIRRLNCHLDFLKGVVLSPDQTLLLSPTERGKFILFSISPDIENCFEISVGEAIYDCCWYPLMRCDDPNSCCFIASTRDHPVHLWDVSGVLRCSYKGINEKEELDVANCIAFNLHGDKIYAGSKKTIRCFDVAHPGSDSTSFSTFPSKDSSGQKGIISCIQFNPDYSGCFAAGSFSNTVGFYVENSSSSVLQIDNLEAGVTSLKWSPDGHRIWIGCRNHCELMCWDVRATRTELGRVRRNLRTNQRCMFDIDSSGRYLVTGSQDNEVLIYDCNSFERRTAMSLGYAGCVNTTGFLGGEVSNLFGCCGERRFFVDGDDEDELAQDIHGLREGKNENSFIFYCSLISPASFDP